MIFRLSQKLSKKIKTGKLDEAPLDENPHTDWSCHLFTANRSQYIILSNTSSLYSCLMLGRGITNDDEFVERALSTICEFMEQDGQAFVFQEFIAPSIANVSFAKALNRSVTGSMNDHIQGSKFCLSDGMTLQDVGFHLNKTPMSALTDAAGRKYANPHEVFTRLAGETDGC